MNERPGGGEPQNRRLQVPEGYNGPGGRKVTPEGNFQVNIPRQDLPVVEQQRQPRRSASREAPPVREPASPRKAQLTDKELRAEKKAHKKRNRVKARKNKRVFSLVWICMVLLISFTISSYLIGGSNDFFGAGRSLGTADVTIPEGELTEDALAELLYNAGLINKPEFFSLYCKIKGDIESFGPGTRTGISTDLDYEALINTLIVGNSTLEEVTVTFPEGSTALQMANLLEENGVCSAQAFLDELNEGDYSNYHVVAPVQESTGRYYKLEGYLFPDTYDFYKNEDLDVVVGKMLNNFQSKVEGRLMDKITEAGMTLDQAVILASIIQAEAAGTADMFEVSAVLHNRLSFGADYGIFNLECDSTSFYPYKNGKELEELGGTLSHGAYDTYQISGLPAGAICNPGLDALNAAVSPSTEGNAPYNLFFCHSDDGVAYYATNAADHEYNKELAGLS